MNSSVTKAQLTVVILTTVMIAAVVNHLVTAWIGLPKPELIYRRVGPAEGPQVFCAGSSVFQFALSWPEVSTVLGRGIENWGVGGSGPEIWEVSQASTTRTNLSLVGISPYDLNENRLSDARANIVPLAQTLQDLWRSETDASIARRVVSQYPLKYLRLLFPASGNSDAVLVGLRRRVRDALSWSTAAEDRAQALVLPDQAVLNFGFSGTKLSDLPYDRLLRRLALARVEIRGQHTFNGPKQVALARLLRRAEQQGGVILVVLPLSSAYEREFLTPGVRNAFEAALAEARRHAPSARIIRLDEINPLKSNDNFSDLVHLNSVGRQLATSEFLRQLAVNPSN